MEGAHERPDWEVVSRAMQLRHLAQAERHSAEGMGHIADQERVIGAMKRAGHDTALALSILATFRLILDGHLEHRERIRRDLDATMNWKSGAVFARGKEDAVSS